MCLKRDVKSPRGVDTEGINPELKNITSKMATMVWIFMSPQNSYVWILKPNVMEPEGGVFRRCLGHESEALTNGISASLKRFQTDPQPLPPGEDRARGHQAMNQKRALTRRQPGWNLDLGLFSLQHCEK